MNVLRLTVEPVPNSDHASEFSRPARLLLDIVRGSELVLRVLDVKWDAVVLQTWLRENRGALLEDLPPSQLSGQGSIASQIATFYEDVDPDDTEALERVFSYRASHGLRFALRGVDVPDVYLGRTTGGYEASCYDAGNSWRYQVDLPAFLNEGDRGAG